MIPSERYRYILRRAWTFGAGRVLFVMLNPSTATETEDDPTIRRCIRFAQRWGFRELAVVNLFAARATQPDNLLRDIDGAVGYENDGWIQAEAINADRVVYAWGALHERLKWRADVVRSQLSHLGREAYCLGLTAKGFPRHPLYVRADVQLQRHGY